MTTQESAGLLGTAAAHASMDVPVAAPDDTAGAIRDGLVGRRFESAAVIAVCAGGHRLAGLMTIEQLLVAPPDAAVKTVMDTDPPVVAPSTDQEHAAWQAVEHGEPGLAVVDEDGRFRGLIAPQRLLAVLLQEHDEDMARLGGFLHSTAEARTASTEKVTHRLWHRLPWLLIGLAGALLGATVIGGFESQLQRHVLIAFFMPGVVYIAAAVGMQTQVLVIRGLSVGVSIRRVVRRELATGILVGAVLAALSLPAIWLLWSESGIATAVAASIFVASSIATVVAMALPWIFAKLGGDPAFGSGPLATIVQDLLSICAYFTTVTLLVP